MRGLMRVGLMTGIVVVAVVVVVLLGSAALYVFINTDAGRSWLTATAEKAAGRAGVELTLSGLTGDLPFDAHVEELVVGGAGGRWVTARGLRVAWAPRDLLSGTLRVTVLRATEVALVRLPTGGGSGTRREPLGGLPELPVAVRVDEVSVGRLRLGEAVPGGPAEFEVDGRAAARHESGVRTHLTLTRLDGPGGRVGAEILFRPAEATLGVDVAVREPAGGVVARLVDVADLPPIEAHLVGEGPITDWRGRLVVTIGDASADLAVRLREATTREVGVRGRVSLGRFAPASVAPLAVGGIRVDVQYRQETTGPRSLTRLSLESHAAAVSAEGTLEPRTGAIRARATLHRINDVAAHGLLAPVRVAGLTGEATVSGTLERPTVAATVAASSLAAPELTVGPVTAQAVATTTGGVAGFVRDMEFRTTLETGRLTWRRPGVERLVNGRARVEAAGTLRSGERIELSTFKIALPQATISGTGDVDWRTERATAILAVGVRDLTALEPLIRRRLLGRTQLQARVEVPAFDGRVRIATRGEVDGFVVGVRLVDALVGRHLDFAADVDVAADRALRLRQVEVRGSGARLHGELDLPPGPPRLRSEAVLTVQDASVLSSALGVTVGGPAEVRAVVSGAPADPAVAGTLSVAQLAIGGRTLQRVSAEYDLAALGSTPTGNVSVQALSSLGPTHARTRVRVGDRAVAFDDLSLDAPALTLGGRLRVPLTGLPVAGALELRSADLGPLLALVGVSGGGKATGRIEFASQASRQQAKGDLRLDDFSLAVAPGLEVRAATAKLATVLDDVLGTPGGSATLEASRISGGSVSLASLAARGRGNLAAFEATMTARGELLGKLDLMADLGVQRRGAKTTVSVRRLAGRALGHPIALRRPATLAFQPGGDLALRDVAVSFAGGELDAQVLRGPAEASVSASVRNLPLALLRIVAPELALDGALSGHAALTEIAGRTTGAAQLRVAGATLLGGTGVAPMDADVSARLAGGRLALKATATGPVTSPIRVTVDLPVMLDLAGGRAELPAHESIRASANWQGPAASILDQLVPAGHVVRGDADVAFHVGGTLAEPVVSGHAMLSRGRYEHLAAGTVLTELTLSFDAQGRDLRLVGLSARDGGRGRVTGSGRLRLDRDAGFPVDLSVAFREATLVRRDDVTATATGDITVAGTLMDATVTGAFTTDVVEARLVANLPPGVVELEVVDPREPTGVEPAATERPRPRRGTRVALQIGVDMPRRVYLRGRGLDSEWQGRLAIGGTTEAPTIAGRLESVRGTMSFLGRRFDLQPSTVRFGGGSEVDPELSIIAAHRAGDVTVTASLTGRATSPTIALASSPPLPEDEILARTLFGESAGKLTPVEAVQLASALAELSGVGGGGRILGSIRDLVGVDVLRVGESEKGTGGPTVEAGKYLTEDVYVGVERGASADSGAVSVEVEVTRNIKLKSSVSEIGRANIGVELKTDY